MEIQIRKLPVEIHKAAKILAAHGGISLEKFFCDAIHAHTLRVAHQRGLTETVIRAIEKTEAKPAAGKRSKLARS